MIDSSVKPGIYIVTADVQLEKRNLPRWTEAMIEVQ
jgi:hypothetical protein